MRIRKIWSWLKVLVARLLPRRYETGPMPRTNLDQILGKKIKERQARLGKPVDTRQGGPNMPRYQPCPKGHGLKKRVDKAVIGGVPGALYYCNRCKGEFFVRAK